MRNRSPATLACGPWRISDLDAELRYWPVLDFLPPQGLICEVGSGSVGIGRWTDRTILAVDPGPDERHGNEPRVQNVRRLAGDGTCLPIADRSVAASVAVDTLEHVVPSDRPRVVREMARVTADGGRVILIGPTGSSAAEADRRLLRRLHSHGAAPDWSIWLDEHVEYGLPTADGLRRWLEETGRVHRLLMQGVFNVHLWWLMHLASMGAIPGADRFSQAWLPFAELAHRWRRGPFYRLLVVAELEAPASQRTREPTGISSERPGFVANGS